MMAILFYCVISLCQEGGYNDSNSENYQYSSDVQISLLLMKINKWFDNERRISRNLANKLTSNHCCCFIIYYNNYLPQNV